MCATELAGGLALDIELWSLSAPRMHASTAGSFWLTLEFVGTSFRWHVPSSSLNPNRNVGQNHNAGANVIVFSGCPHELLLNFLGI